MVPERRGKMNSSEETSYFFARVHRSSPCRCHSAFRCSRSSQIPPSSWCESCTSLRVYPSSRDSSSSTCITRSCTARPFKITLLSINLREHRLQMMNYFFKFLFCFTYCTESLAQLASPCYNSWMRRAFQWHLESNYPHAFPEFGTNRT